MNEKKLVERLIKLIVKQAFSIVGPVAYSQASLVEGIEAKDKKIKVLNPKKEMIIKLIETYKKIMGESIRGIVVMAVVSELKKNPEIYDDLKTVLPEWVFESPDIQVMRLAGIVR
ncbi:MAG: hypothetical protein GXO63_03190 [Candidatus Micrarchaeota archaeon]|nr:hypothetical protein [Candidatus Micrarchaeota archaeon]